MVDPDRLLSPELNGRMIEMLQSDVDPLGFEVSSKRVRRVILESNASDTVKRYVLHGLKPILQGRTVKCVTLGILMSQLALGTDDEGIITISMNMKNLDKLPFVIENGKPVAKPSRKPPA